MVHIITTANGPVTPVAIEQAVESVAGVDLAAAVGVGPAGTQQVVVVVAPDRSTDAARSRAASRSPNASGRSRASTSRRCSSFPRCRSTSATTRRSTGLELAHGPVPCSPAGGCASCESPPHRGNELARRCGRANDCAPGVTTCRCSSAGRAGWEFARCSATSTIDERSMPRSRESRW